MQLQMTKNVSNLQIIIIWLNEYLTKNHAVIFDGILFD